RSARIEATLVSPTFWTRYLAGAISSEPRPAEATKPVGIEPPVGDTTAPGTMSIPAVLAAGPITTGCSELDAPAKARTSGSAIALRTQAVAACGSNLKSHRRISTGRPNNPPRELTCLAHASIPNMDSDRSVPAILVSPSAAKTIGLPVGAAAAAVDADAAVDGDAALDGEVLALLPQAASVKLASATYPMIAFIIPPLPAV